MNRSNKDKGEIVQPILIGIIILLGYVLIDIIEKGI